MVKKQKKKLDLELERHARKSQKKLIVGNWKMDPQTMKEASSIFLKTRTIAGSLRKVDTVVCPPAVFLGDLRAKVTGSRCVLGAQDCHFEPSGAHTGEVSSLQLKSLGVRYVIIGHSERRKDGESDERVGKKVEAVLRSGLSVILCVGEEGRDRGGRYLGKIHQQILVDLQSVPKKDLGRVVIAYEPIWAIGEKARRSAHPRDVLEMKIFIRKVLSDMFGKSDAEKVLFLYGGSVDEKNARDFLLAGEADGLLVGRASLEPKVFGEILKITESL